MRLLDDNKAQLSAELIIVLAAVLAVALMVVTSLRGTAADGEKISESTATKLFKELK